MKRIIMAYDDEIAYEETVAECLVTLFGDKAEDGVGSSDGEKPDGNTTGADTKPNDELTESELIQKAVESFEKAQSAQQDGDWAKYGKYLDELEKYLNQLAS